MNRVVIVGAGQAGLQVAVSLREEGYPGEVVLLGAEPHLPYQRPPLSKAFATGEMTQDQLLLRKPEYFENSGIAVRVGEEVDRIADDPLGVRTVSGQRIECDWLVLALGAEPRRFTGEGGDLPGVVTLRTLDDSLALRAMLGRASRVAVLGGGFIGLEVASVARKLGRKVTVVESSAQLMGRSISGEFAGFFLDAHRRRGLDILLETRVTRIHGSGAGVKAVELDDGRLVEAELVVVGIGADPRTALAKDIGLDVDRGVLCDGHTRTSNPRILAVGDCSQHRDLCGMSVTLESVQNAVDQAKIAAKVIMGEESQTYSATPWFWSDQADLKIQMAGMRTRYDRVVQRGSKEEEAFSLLYFGKDTLLAIESVNRPGDQIAGRRFIGRSMNVTDEQIQNTGVPLMKILSEASEPP